MSATDRLREAFDSCTVMAGVDHVIGRGDVTQGEWDALESELGLTMQVKVISRAYLAKAKE